VTSRSPRTPRTTGAPSGSSPIDKHLSLRSDKAVSNFPDKKGWLSAFEANKIQFPPLAGSGDTGTFPCFLFIGIIYFSLSIPFLTSLPPKTGPFFSYANLAISPNPHTAPVPNWTGTRCRVVDSSLPLSPSGRLPPHFFALL